MSFERSRWWRGFRGGVVLGFLVTALVGLAWRVPHHHRFDRWSIVSREHQAGPLYQTRTCQDDGCGFMESHQVFKP